ncbi:GNAT family N-acetyltransferase [Brevundimonas sp. 2R-24]|uniref:GNAT family N-acetyltransferase n=1 Tax=Peiella sedimenti TaxID=3061083 RepID=A0ABT8SK65_9CAUL|nr:GNAT family N-acetyltransferase [Caulobacteraceae bacterium XZ-24]
MIRIISLHERPELAPALTAALIEAWPKWYGPGGSGDARREAAARAGRGLPRALVALDGDQLIGTASLVETSIPTHAHLRPWLGGLWVRPEARERGLGLELVRASRAAAKHMGISRLHAATASAASLFRRDDWSLIDETELPAHPGEIIGVWAIDLV